MAEESLEAATDNSAAEPTSDGSFVIKAHVLGSGKTTTSVLDQVRAAGVKGNEIEGTIAPKFSADTLIRLWEMSCWLAPNVDALCTNVDGFGHRFEPAIDLDSSDADDRVRQDLLLQRLHDAIGARDIDHRQDVDLSDEVDPASGSFPDFDHLPDPQRRFDLLEEISVQEPSEAEVAARKKHLEQVARIELARAQSFFEYACPEGSFISFRRALRQDMEITGRGAFEVLRDREGRLARLLKATVTTIRRVPADAAVTRIEELVRTSELRWERKPQHRYFGRYAQIGDSADVKAYFKEFGDPRLVSRKTGKAYRSVLAMRRAEGRDVQPATEMVMFTIPHPTEPYGAPRWLGNSPAVLGSRELDETNLDYFRSNSVPPLAILVSGGAFRQDVQTNLEDFFDQKVVGRGTHKVVILEALPARTAGTTGPVPKIEFVPLRDAQQQDALFQAYDERNADKISQSFRLPRLLTGRDRTINRSTAEASIRFAQDQVFAPERNVFDEWVNRRLLPAIGVFFWKFKSNGPATQDPIATANVLTSLAVVGALSPNEAREIAGELFNRQYSKWRQAWANQPLPITLAEMKVPELASQMFDALRTGMHEGAGESGSEAHAEPAGKPSEDHAAPPRPRMAPIHALGPRT